MASPAQDKVVGEENGTPAAETAFTASQSSILYTTDTASTSQDLAVKDGDRLRDGQQALIEELVKLKSPSKVVEFVSGSPMEFQKLVASLNYTNHQLNNQVNILTQQKAVLENASPVFHMFPKLPIELRLKIWKLASDVPWLIRLGGIPHRGSEWMVEPYRHYCYQQQVPAVLHASCESRKQASKSYGLYSEALISYKALRYHNKRLITGKSRYFNHEHDILYIGINEFERLDLHGDYSYPENYGFSNLKLCRLAFDVVCWKPPYGSSHNQPYIIWGLKNYPNLQELIFIDDGVRCFANAKTPDCVVVPKSEKDHLNELVDKKLIYTSDFIANATKVIRKLEDENPLQEDENPIWHNPFLRKGRTLPKITVMRMLPSSFMNSSLKIRRDLDIC